MKRLYKLPITLLIEVDESAVDLESYLSDAASAILSDQQKKYIITSCLVDYAVHIDKTETSDSNPETYEEGEAFQ